MIKNNVYKIALLGMFVSTAVLHGMQNLIFQNYPPRNVIVRIGKIINNSQDNVVFQQGDNKIRIPQGSHKIDVSIPLQIISTIQSRLNNAFKLTDVNENIQKTIDFRQEAQRITVPHILGPVQTENFFLKAYVNPGNQVIILYEQSLANINRSSGHNITYDIDVIINNDFQINMDFINAAIQ